MSEKVKRKEVTLSELFNTANTSIRIPDPVSHIMTYLHMPLFKFYSDISDNDKKWLPEIESVSETIHRDREKNIVKLFGSRTYNVEVYAFDNSYNSFNEEEVTTGDVIQFQVAFETVSKLNRRKYDKMWLALIENYNPLSNYDKHSVISEKHVGDLLVKEGTETDTLTKTGTETDTLTKTGTETDKLTKTGTETDTLTKTGTETDTLTKTGNEETSKLHGAQKETSTHSTFPENNTSEYNTEKNVTNNDTFTDKDTTTFANRQDTDTLTFTNRQDTDTLTFANREDENVKSFQDREDESVKSFQDREDESVKSFQDRQDESVKSFENRVDSMDYTITTTEDTSGNIGTTKNTDMLMDEYFTRLKLDFFETIVKDVLFTITY